MLISKKWVHPVVKAQFGDVIVKPHHNPSTLFHDLLKVLKTMLKLNSECIFNSTLWQVSESNSIFSEFGSRLLLFISNHGVLEITTMKFAYDITVVGLISNSVESAYREEVNQLAVVQRQQTICQYWEYERWLLTSGRLVVISLHSNINDATVERV